MPGPSPAEVVPRVPEFTRFDDPRHVVHPRPQESYAGWTMLGALVGFLVVGVLAALALARDAPDDPTAGLISAVHGEGAFELAVPDAAHKLLTARPVESFTSLEDIPAYDAYLNDAVKPARTALASYPTPARLETVAGELTRALDRYTITFGAAATCMRNDDPCAPQRHDVRDAVDEVVRLAYDLQAATAG